ncbi:hypothetical protein [Galactobacter valiniphilus]|uniref:hypothetical protein n=1 Tax=Galactobacter valiniphilus TaxID=2676122 RepID=UPI003735680C
MRHEESAVWAYVRDRLSAQSRSGGVEPSRDVLESLAAYLRAARGRHVETFGLKHAPPDSFTAEDLLAVSFLSVFIPRGVSL